MESVYCPTEFEKYLQVFLLLSKAQDVTEVNAKIQSMLLPPNFKSDKLKHCSQSTKFMIPDTYFKGQNVWILKVTGFNRGVGIHVFNTLPELFKLLKEYSDQLGDK
jgi:hypothetical protein